MNFAEYIWVAQSMDQVWTGGNSGSLFHEEVPRAPFGTCVALFHRRLPPIRRNYEQFVANLSNILGEEWWALPNYDSRFWKKRPAQQFVLRGATRSEAIFPSNSPPGHGVRTPHANSHIMPLLWHETQSISLVVFLE